MATVVNVGYQPESVKPGRTHYRGIAYDNVGKEVCTTVLRNTPQEAITAAVNLAKRIDPRFIPRLA